MRVCYSPGYSIPLPQGHRFPMGKYEALHHILTHEGLVHPSEIVTPEQASWDDLATVHTTDYLERLRTGSPSRGEERVLGLPWSPALLRRSRLAVQGTLSAAELALSEGIAANLAGGTHHAFPAHGEGFCVFNDVAVAVRVLQRRGTLRRALVVDLDVHQGNGTAAIFEGDPDVYTFSIHGERNFPFRKQRSRLDVGLPDLTGDDAYLEVLDAHLPRVIDEATPTVVFYLAGVDPAAGDRLGRMRLTRQGLAARDAVVLEALKQRGLPVVLVLAGGYAATPELTADLHAITHRQARRIFG